MAINLLPAKEKREVRGVYRAHLAIAILIVADLLVVSAGVLLVAGMIDLRQEKKIKSAELIGLSADVQVKEFNQVRDRLNVLAGYLAVAKGHVKTEPPVLPVIASIIAAGSADIDLDAFDYEFVKNEQVLKLGGLAASRQALLDFVTKLEALPEVKSVDSPPANFVNNVDVEFLLTVNLQPDRLYE